MKTMSLRIVLALVFLASASAARAQTADEVLEKSIAAMGGRAALMKLKSRSAIGDIALSTPAGEIAGTVEIVYAAPNKNRTLIKADLSSLGAGQLVVDQRFNGTVGYSMDSLQGNRDITGNQLDNLRNGAFPHPYLNYKEMGATVKLAGKEKVGDRDAYVIVMEPTAGSSTRQFIDAETYLPLRMVVKVEVPQLGQEIEQTTSMLDYRDVDGVKLPFKLVATSSVQNYTITISKIEHNGAVDEKLFSKPAQ